MDIKTVVGISAGVLTAVSALPQIFKVLKDKKVEAVSPFMFVVLLIGNGMWFWYGLLLSELPIIVTNAFSFCCSAVMIFLNYRFADRS
jgi:MtN3 and saliva related transmembrane protein